MTQEEKDLLLKDLCARLPYKVKIAVDDEVEILEGISALDTAAEYDSIRSSDIEEVKPYLFPLSSITEEQAKELFNKFDLVCPSTEEDYIKINECTGITFFLSQGFDVETHLYKLIDWLLKNHFDIYGLIPMGLAIDATDLNIY